MLINLQMKSELSRLLDRYVPSNFQALGLRLGRAGANKHESSPAAKITSKIAGNSFLSQTLLLLKYAYFIHSLSDEGFLGLAFIH